MTVIKPPPLPELPELSMDRMQSFSSPAFWGISNPRRFQELMEEAKTLVEPGYYLGDNLFTWGRNNSAFEDNAFVHALSSNALNPSGSVRISVCEAVESVTQS